MYGLINKALKDMIQSEFGEEQWQAVFEASGIPQDSFLTMRSYDDQLTYALAGAASEVLGAPVEACLEMFGVYWVKEVAAKAYGSLMDATGQDMVGFLANINGLHDRITGTFLNYVPPEFQIESIDEKHHRVHYISQREGLTPFVVGLFKGLADHFSCELEIQSQEPVGVDRGEHTVFEVTLQ
ncbi:guanylyl cyclase [Halioglobus maricola]|uniref:Guanylyl cyclase n=1 Tax=Halioglobus maricola TaxID=2601894 RepID=A0A5P9NMR9_9GAMM|nr:heme NO-binding domain-containing protein [Halioglobus maricola]QFU77163.1 guanylyl cyclase [Halioglobus maricola]